LEAALIFPNQLFRNNPHLENNVPVYLVEEDTYFTRYRFHKKKLILHRASMKSFDDELKKYEATYIENKKNSTIDELFKLLEKDQVTLINLTEILDYRLEELMVKYSKKYNIRLNITDNPGFLTDIDWIKNFFSSNKFNMTSFYIAQRKRLEVLVDDEKPVGGKWSFDPENRRKLPKEIELPEPWKPIPSEYIYEAEKYVKLKFPNNPGSSCDFDYPINWEQAEKSLKDFIDNRFELFGDYQDAISKRSGTLFHSIISPSLNIGLLTPRYVLEEVLEAHKNKEFPMNSLEGFIRQLIGWREYMRAIYILRHDESIDANYWGYDKPLPASFYDAKTGIEPLDDTLRKVNQSGYAHHIERLMILGNFCLLAKINPSEVYRWFMEMFIDSYEWVMEPNVLGMSQYADGGGITTKPYVSSSNYIRRMSGYGKGDWSEIWDALFWNFITENKEKIYEIPRMRVIIYNLEKMPDNKIKKYSELAKERIKLLQ
jgi:deoxyribodipyrimidine photolyase-related protein